MYGFFWYRVYIHLKGFVYGLYRVSNIISFCIGFITNPVWLVTMQDCFVVLNPSQFHGYCNDGIVRIPMNQPDYNGMIPWKFKNHSEFTKKITKDHFFKYEISIIWKWGLVIDVLFSSTCFTGFFLRKAGVICHKVQYPKFGRFKLHSKLVGDVWGISPGKNCARSLRFIRIPYWKYDNPGGDYYWKGVQPEEYST